MARAASGGGRRKAAELNRAVDELFLAGEAPPSDAPGRRWLEEDPEALLDAVLERGDKRLLAAALRRGDFDPALLRRKLKGGKELPFPLRALLSHPELAADVPLPVKTEEKSGAPEPPEPGETLLRLERWQFDLGVAYPALRRAVTEMPRRPDEDIAPFGTDGLSLYFREEDCGDLRFADLQHALLHCVFRHMLPPEKALPSLWDLASDMAAEFLRAELFPSPESRDIRFAVQDALPAGSDPRSANEIYRALMELFPDELTRLSERFRRDDHRYWYAPPPDRRGRSPDAARSVSGGPGEGGLSPGEEEELRQSRLVLEQKLEEKWSEPGRTMKEKRRPLRRQGFAPGSREEKMLLREQGKYDFTRYIRRFSVLREELQLDQSSFDYIPYCFGLEHYGNMPLLEPLEYTESYRIQELVIAIDTSGSCSRETVRRFLAETERILMQKENFFRKMNIHIMQCDARVQDDRCIRSLEEWQSYLADLRIRGRGGTSFVPVFERVERLQKQGRLKNLKGLLYFTDGDGLYPRKKPPYEAAFVFSERDALERSYPDWIVPLCLE